MMYSRRRQWRCSGGAGWSRKCFVQSVAKIGQNENAKGVLKRTGGGPGAPKGYRGTKNDMLTPAAAVAMQRRRWESPGSVLFEMSQRWFRIKMQRVFRSEPVVAQGHRRGTEEQKMTCSRRRRQWLCSGGDAAVKFKMLQIWLKNQNAEGIPRRTGGGPGAPRGYRRVKGGVLTPAAAVAVQRRRLDDQGSVVLSVSQLWLKIKMQWVFRSEPVMAQGHRGVTEESKGDVLTLTAAAVRQRRRRHGNDSGRTGLHWAYATNASITRVVFEFGLHSGSSRLKRKQNKVLQLKNVQE